MPSDRINHSRRLVAGRITRSHNRSARRSQERRGAMLVLIVIMLIGFLVTVVFSVDVAHMHLSRTELRSATDAAAQAASVELSSSLDPDLAIEKGREIALLNRVDGQPLELLAEDFEFGRSELEASGAFVFVADEYPNNSVRVTGRRTEDSASGSIPLMFGHLLGMSTFEPRAVSAATYIERDVVLVVDRSGSMQGAKFDSLRSAIDVFINTLAATPVDERVGLASYNQNATEDVALTENLNQIGAAMTGLSTGGRTSISRGMEAGAAILYDGRDADYVERTLIVMTDGIHNEGIEPASVAVGLAADRVTIHTITFGEGADQERMIDVAEIGGGKHFHALTEAQLVEAYREIALALGTMITE